MTRAALIEQILRAVYGGQPPSDSNITDNLVNIYISQGVAIAAKNNYKENVQLEGVGYVNSSYFSTFKGIVISQDENYLYKFSMPQIPVGIGDVDGVSRVLIKNAKGDISYPVIMLNQGQVSIQRGLRNIPNRLLGYPEGGLFYLITTLPVNTYTATVTLISGGSDTDLTSTINLPPDAVAFVVDYCKAQLMAERLAPQNLANDGADFVKAV